MTQCLVDGCRGPACADAPIPLCGHHVALVAEWAAARDGVTDVLPAPCHLCGSRLGVRWPSAWLCAVCEWPHGDLVDGDLPPPRVDVVYYLRFDDRVKIGTTAHPRQRFAAIRHHDLLALEKGDRRLEQRRHAQFAAERFSRTEWFALSDDLAIHIDVLRGEREPWDLWSRWISEAVAAQG